ncbi:glycosyltransferase family 4 protein [Salinimicrobium soli]|uniref:glycosyltransferase family 4 protein n=1 Tax=Salinimicrobium soli TaxID=1254399 RepID=UPI003AB0B7CF
MKILLLVDDYLPHSTKIGAKMMHELGLALLNEGHQVSVATPDYRVSGKYVIEDLEGLRVYRFRSPDVKAPSKVRRAINESLLSFNGWRNLKSHFYKNPCDLIIYYSPSIFFGPLVTKLKKKWNAKSYLILRDLFPQWVIDHGLIKEKSAIAAYFRKFEQLNYKAADRIGLQSPKNLELFNEKYVLNHKSEVLFNWTRETPIDSSGNDFRRKYRLEDKVVFFYGGNMGEAQDMMNLVRLALGLKNNPNAHFVFAGSGNEVHLIKNAIREYQLNNLTLLDPVPQGEYRKMLSEFDIGLFSLHKEHTTHNFPGKLLGYMAQGLPILGSVNAGNDIIEIINEAGAGKVLLNGKDDDFLSMAKMFVDKNEWRKEAGKNSFELLQHTFSVDSATKKVLTAVQSIA